MDFWKNIESYINNDLSETERKVFEKAMSTDAALRQSVEEQRLLINLLRQNKGSNANNQSLDDVIKRKRLKGIIDGYIAKLPDAPVEMPEKEENTEGVKIVPLNPKPFKEPPISKPSPLVVVKKTNIWWAAAASLAVVAAVGIWLNQPKKDTPNPITVEKNNQPTLGDTSKEINIPKPEENALIIQPKVPPQYQTTKKPQTRSSEPVNTTIPPIEVETQVSKDAVLAIIENVANSEYKEITEPTKGASSSSESSISREDQLFRKALEAIAANKPTIALDLLKNKNDEKARYYQALAYVLIDKTKGKRALEALANDEDLEMYFRNKIKDLLKKL